MPSWSERCAGVGVVESQLPALPPKRVGSYFKSRRPDPRRLFFLSQLRVVFARGGFLPVVENIGPAPLVHPQISAGPPFGRGSPHGVCCQSRWPLMATAIKASTRSAARSLRISVVIYPARPDLDRHGAKLSGAVWKLTRSPCLTRDPANWCPNNVQIRRHTDYPREFLDLRTFYAGP